VWIVAAGALIFACGPHARRGDSTAASTATAAPTSISIRRAPASARDELSGQAHVAVNGGVQLTLQITNQSDHAIEVNFANGQTHDFAVVDSLGREVWRWSAGRMFTQSIQNRLIAPRQTVSFEESWKEAPSAGSFIAVAVLESSNYPLTERVGFSLP